MFDILNDLVDAAPPEAQIENITTIGGLTSIAINVMFGISMSISIIMLAFGAFRYVVSSGDPKLIEKSYHTMFWSLIAGLVTILAVVIKNMVVNAFGINSATVPDF